MLCSCRLICWGHCHETLFIKSVMTAVMVGKVAHFSHVEDPRHPEHIKTFGPECFGSML